MADDYGAFHKVETEGDYAGFHKRAPKLDPYGNPIPTMGANPNPVPDDSAALDQQFEPGFLSDAPMGGLDKGPLRAAGNMARFIAPVTLAPLAPAIAGAAAVGPPALASLGARTAAGAAVGGVADYGLRKAGVSPDVANIVGLVLGLKGLKGGKVGASTESEYLPALMDSVKREVGLPSLAATAEEAATVAKPKWEPQSADVVTPAQGLKTNKKVLDAIAQVDQTGGPKKPLPLKGGSNVEGIADSLDRVRATTPKSDPTSTDDYARSLVRKFGDQVQIPNKTAFVEELRDQYGDKAPKAADEIMNKVADILDGRDYQKTYYDGVQPPKNLTARPPDFTRNGVKQWVVTVDNDGREIAPGTTRVGPNGIKYTPNRVVSWAQDPKTGELVPAGGITSLRGEQHMLSHTRSQGAHDLPTSMEPIRKVADSLGWEQAPEETSSSMAKASYSRRSEAVSGGAANEASNASDVVKSSGPTPKGGVAQAGSEAGNAGSLDEGVGGGGEPGGGKAPRVSLVERATNEAAELRKQIGDATYRMNTAKTPAMKNAFKMVKMKLEEKLAARMTKIAGSKGGAGSLIVPGD